MTDEEDSGDALFARADAEIRKPNADVEVAVRLMKKAADAGHPMASYAIATWYLHGKEPFLPVDFAKAVHYLQYAANAHIPAALYDLAVCYTEGEGVEKNDEVAFEYYLRAALHGDAVSVNSVGTCYFYGYGVQQDKRVADIWRERAEELGTFRSEE